MERKQLIPFLTGIFILVLTSVRVPGQELVYEKKVDSLLIPGKLGPNRLHYHHFIFGTSVMVPQESLTSSDYRFPFSGNLWLGYRYKLKVARPLALVGEAGIRHTSASVRQSEGKVFPDSILHIRQSIKADDLFGGLFVRIRFGQKGNYLGNYLDAGVQGSWSIKTRLVEVDKESGDPAGWFSRKRTVFSGLDFINPLAWQLVARLGFDRVAIIAAYRLPAILADSKGPDFPDLTIGLEFSPVRY